MVKKLRPETTQRVIDIFTRVLDQQDEKGFKKYGVTIDDAIGYDWNEMALEEAADLVKYLVKENKRLRELIHTQKLIDHREAVFMVKAGKLVKLETPGSGFGKLTISFQNGKPIYYEVSSTVR